MSVMISQLPPAASLTGAEQIPIVQNSTTVRATAQAIADLGAGASFGNPTAQIGLSPVNGVAATAMRSDAAPSLDEGISPTWTGAHTFNNTVALSADTTIEGDQVGYLDVPQNLQNDDYVFELEDRGRHVYQSGAGIASTWVVPNNADAPFPLGSAITLVNDGASPIDIAGDFDVLLVQAGTGLEVSLFQLDAFGMGTLLKVGADRWYFNGVGITVPE
jgi:hypothetical protein